MVVTQLLIVDKLVEAFLRLQPQITAGDVGRVGSSLSLELCVCGVHGTIGGKLVRYGMCNQGKATKIKCAYCGEKKIVRTMFSEIHELVGFR